MFDGSSVEGFVRIEESDMILAGSELVLPLPWRPSLTGSRVLSAMHTPDGKPFQGSPRQILKTFWQECADMVQF